MVHVIRTDPFLDAYVTNWLLCVKVATALEITRDGARTELNYVNLSGTSLACTFSIKGNPYGLEVGAKASFPIGGARLAAAGDPITALEIGTAAGLAWRVSGLNVTPAALVAILTDADFDAAYAAFIDLFDGNDVLRGAGPAPTASSRAPATTG